MRETYTPPTPPDQVTLATRRLYDTDVLIVAHGSVMQFFPTDDRSFSPQVFDACAVIAFTHHLAQEAPQTPAPAPPVKRNTLLGWLRSLLSPAPPLKPEIQSQQGRR